MKFGETISDIYLCLSYIGVFIFSINIGSYPVNIVWATRVLS